MNDENFKLPVGVPHPAAISATRFINTIPKDELKDWQGVFADMAKGDEGNLLAATCASTVERVLGNKSVGDRFILGLAWTLLNMAD